MVVSGLTAGIDAEGARGAVRADGIVIGVTGTAINAPFGGHLVQDVASQGAVLSEFAPGSGIGKVGFRMRNRITAGLSLAAVIVEAPARSGALLFAEDADALGRELFAVPGNADAENSVGTLALLKEGAKLVTTGWEVLNEFEALYPDKLHHGREPYPAEERAAETPTTAPVAAKKAIDKPEGKGYIDLAEQLSKLTEDQLKIVTAIDRSASHIDDIIEATGLPTAKVLAQLTILEIKGYIRREAGRRIALNIAKK